jgi:hypothetical protein
MVGVFFDLGMTAIFLSLRGRKIIEVKSLTEKLIAIPAHPSPLPQTDSG